MQKQFNLILTNRWRTTLVVLATVVLFILGLFGAGLLFERWHWLGIGTALLVAGIIIFLPEILGRRFSTELVVVTIDDTGFTVQPELPSLPRRIAFADIDSYYFDLNNDFNVRPRHGAKLVLHLNAKIHPQGLAPLHAMGRHFEAAVAQYQQLPTSQPIRRLSFFSRAVATFWLVVFAGLVAWLGYRTKWPAASEGDWGVFILLGLSFAVYALQWYHARRETLG